MFFFQLKQKDIREQLDFKNVHELNFAWKCSCALSAKNSIFLKCVHGQIKFHVQLFEALTFLGKICRSLSLSTAVFFFKCWNRRNCSRQLSRTLIYSKLFTCYFSLHGWFFANCSRVGSDSFTRKKNTQLVNYLCRFAKGNVFDVVIRVDTLMISCEYIRIRIFWFVWFAILLIMRESYDSNFCESWNVMIRMIRKREESYDASNMRIIRESYAKHTWFEYDSPSMRIIRFANWWIMSIIWFAWFAILKVIWFARFANLRVMRIIGLIRTNWKLIESNDSRDLQNYRSIES